MVFFITILTNYHLISKDSPVSPTEYFRGSSLESIQHENNSASVFTDSLYNKCASDDSTLFSSSCLFIARTKFEHGIYFDSTSYNS